MARHCLSFQFDRMLVAGCICMHYMTHSKTTYQGQFKVLRLLSTEIQSPRIFYVHSSLENLLLHQKIVNTKL